MIDRIRQHLIPATVTFCMAVSLGVGLLVQDAADPLMMLPVALMGIWLAVTGRLLRIPLNDPALLGLILLWLCWAVSVTLTDFPFNSKVTWIIMSTLPVSYIVWRAGEIDRTWQKFNLIIFLLSGIALGIGALVQATIMPEGTINGRPGYPFADPNMLGIFLSLLLLPTLPLLMTSTLDNRLRVVLGIGALVMAGGLFATQSRSAFLGAGAGGVLILVLLRHHILWTKQKLIALGATLMAGLVTLVATGFIERFISIFQSGGDKDVNSRLALWQTAFSMSMNHPVTGYGFGTFSLYYPVFRNSGDTNSAGWWVHMDPLQWAVESGWQTPIVFYCLVTYLAIRIWQQASQRLLSPLQIGCAGALLCLFLNAHSAYPLHVIPFMLIATGMMTLLLPVTSAHSPSSPRVATTFGSIMLVTLLLAFWSGMKVGGTLYLWQELNTARKEMQEVKFNDTLDRCIKVGDPQFAYCRLMMIEVYLKSPEQPGSAVIEMIDEARRYNPSLPQPDFYMGMYHLRAKPPEILKAIESFRKALINNPTFFPARKALITALQQSGQFYEALQAIEKGAAYPIPANEVEGYKETLKNLRNTVYAK